MDKHPFSKPTDTQDALASRRRSTRIEFTTTVLLSGKDAGGTPFREFTQTITVNLHGCKVRTSYRIIVGMLVNIECPKAGTSGKGVCVRVWDPVPGAAGHEIAVQLIKPQNLWGVPNPPADWEMVAKTMVQGRTQTEIPAPVLPPATPSTTAPSTTGPRRTTVIIPSPLSSPSPLPSATPTRQMPSLASRLAAGISQSPPPAATPPPPAAPPAPAPVATPIEVPPAAPVATPAPPPVAAPSPGTRTRQFPAVPSPAAAADPRLADLERRATQLVGSVLDIMRGQAEELTRNILEEFRQQVEALIVDSEERLRQGFQSVYKESASSLINLRGDLIQQMQSRGTQMIRTSEETLRTRLREQLTVDETPAPETPPAKVTDK